MDTGEYEAMEEFKTVGRLSRRTQLRKPEYCTQNDGKCETCNLVIYGRDCKKVPIKENWEKAKSKK